MKKQLIPILLLLSFQIAQAQTENYLIYKEYEPNYWIELMVDQQYDIDINDDGIADIRYETFQGGSGSWTIASYAFAINNWEACNFCVVPCGYNNVFFDLSIPLNTPSLVWDSRCLAESYGYNQLPLHFKVALRLSDGANYYYGWVEFDENREGYYKALLHVSRTCFCAIPNYPLRWGQTNLNEGTEENEATAFAIVYPNPTTGLVTITGKALKQAEVLNTLGQQVATTQGKGETLHIDIANLPTGIYFVRVTDEEGRKCVRKVIKE